MSSMLKKTGGLAFKPKAGARRGAAASGGGAASTTSANTTRAPTAELSSQASTPHPQTSESTANTTSTTQEAGRIPPSEVVAQATPTISAINESQADTTTPTNTASAAKAPVRKQIPQQKKGTGDSGSQPQHTVAPTPIPTPTQTQAQAQAQAPEATAPAAPTATATTRSSQDGIAQPTPPPTTSESPAATRLPPRSPQPVVAAETASLPENQGRPSTAPRSPRATTTESAPTGPSDDARPTETIETAPAPKKKRVYKKRQAPQNEAAEGSEAASGSTAPKPKRQPRKRKQPSAATEGEESTSHAPDAAEEPTPSAAAKRRKRSATPEDAENQQVDHSQLKVGDLTKDLRIGKKFKHADIIAERAREARAKQRLKRIEKQKRKLGLPTNEDNDGSAAGSRSGTPADGQENGGGTDPLDISGGMSSSGGGVGYEVVDGQIVVNQQSLVVDRHADQDMSTMVTVEEDDFTHLTTSHSYLRESRAIGSNSWSDEDTEKFYRCLQMFGTDFETISHMFPGKSRRHVKLKFNREERHRPNRVNAAIMVRGQKTVEIDIDEYKGYRKQWQETTKIQEEQDRLADEHRKEVRRLKAERRAQGLHDGDDDDDDDDNNKNKDKANKDNADGGDSGETDKVPVSGAPNTPPEEEEGGEETITAAAGDVTVEA